MGDGEMGRWEDGESGKIFLLTTDPSTPLRAPQLTTKLLTTDN